MVKKSYLILLNKKNKNIFLNLFMLEDCLVIGYCILEDYFYTNNKSRWEVTIRHPKNKFEVMWKYDFDYKITDDDIEQIIDYAKIIWKEVKE